MRKKPLSQLLAQVETTLPPKVASLEVAGVSTDSRKVEPGHLFVCIRGTRTDGHAFASQAAERGAVALVVEGPVEGVGDLPQVVVPDTRRAWALICKAWFDHAADQLTLVGVTGTNGKTSTCLLIREILEVAGHPTAALGTLGVTHDGREFTPLGLTTPDPYQIHRECHRAVEEGITHLVMEVTSHALHQKRVAGTQFAAACFTNLSQDHFDYHGTREEYERVKFSLFTDYLSEGGVAVVNLDDESGRRLANLLRERGTKLITFGLESEQADLSARSLSVSLAGNRFILVFGDAQAEVASALVGRHNIMNCLAAAGVGLALGIGLAKVKAGLERLRLVPGRLEPVVAGQPFRVLVDYAHTPDALRRVLSMLNELRQRPGERIITVFGCGGDRDQEKRGPMGVAAVELSEVAVITSDNPRSEDPDAIIDQIVAGLREAGLPAPEKEGEVMVSGEKKVIRLRDRREAIAWALREARPGDTVLIAGKGHEDYQLIGARRLPFDDRQVARELIEQLLTQEAMG